MKTSPAACDLEAAVPADTAAAEAEAEAKTAAAAAAKQQAPAANKVADAAEEQEAGRALRRWAFARRMYATLSLQFVLAAAFAATAWLVPAVPRFFAHGPRAAVRPTLAVVLVSPLIVMLAMRKLREKHPRSRVRFPLFTICCSLSVSVFTLCCSLSIAVTAFFGTVASASSTLDTVLLQATILTVLGLTLFAFWAAKRGYDYIYTTSYLFAALIEVLVYYIIEIPFPLVMVAVAICGLLATLVFSSFTVIVVDELGL